MGDGEDKEKEFSESIQPELTSSWGKILNSGLSDEVRKDLAKKYLPPDNCKELYPPKINPEVKIALSENTIKRDERLVQLQGQVGAATSAVALLITNMVKEGGEANKEHIETLNDIGRLLCNVHYSESVSRRELLLINLNKDIQDPLRTTPISNFLFGNELDNTIKSAKELVKSSEQLKPKKKIARPALHSSGNLRRPLRRGAHQSGQTTRTPNQQRRATDQRLQFQPKKSTYYQNDKRRRPT